MSRSAELYGRALRALPGGVNSPVRAMRQIGRDPIFIERGEGCELIDVDGNRYLDWVCSWGPLILGHAEPGVVAAVSEAAARGTSYGAATAAEVELAEEVCRRLASVEMVRMTSSGTEAAMSAVRLARAATGREKVVKFAGAYHGHSDGLLADGRLGHGDAGGAGEPRGHRRPGRGDRGRALERPRRRSRRRWPSTRLPPCWPSRSPPTWAWSRPPRAFSTSCARRPTRRGRCSSSTR